MSTHLKNALNPMNRPLLSRMLPNHLKQMCYYRYYHTRHSQWLGLFDEAPLSLVPHVSMYGLIPGDIISGNLAFNGFYELPLSTRILQLAKERVHEPSVFVDIGANMGYFSLLWAGAAPLSRVIAFEASPRNVAIIENNIQKNGLKERITLVAKAAGDHLGTIRFEVGPSEQTGWGGIASSSASNTIEVEMVRLDQQLPDTTIDVLKIDVEGADTLVLRGCEELLKQKRIKMIFFEQNDTRMKTLGIASGEAREFLRNLDYTCVPFGKGDGEWVAYPNKTKGSSA